ncbi:4Fe-4S dicluster domain-containing protein [Silicimonas algicola]|nr:4Fe-4S dicluster domain-containing protein [Silicimonas algicola]AZQ65824.1 4Fe-4S dicluster domain-containing protein [Silicimonas algicola]
MTAPKRLLLCTCEDTQAVDPQTASTALGGIDVRTVRALCMGNVDAAAKALAQEGETLIACGQMSAFFEDLAEELGAPERLATVDIRDRAGWTDTGTAFPKQAALLAESLVARPDTPTRDVTSEGTCLILGPAHVAVPAAESLAGSLAVTCLVAEDPGDMAPPATYDLALGRLKKAGGALGRFAVEVDGYRAADPGGRGAVRFGPAADGAKSTCDILLDLRGEGPLFSADHKREGYVRADPGDPIAVARAVAEARELQGVFEKPLYIRFDPGLCAHSRASQPGCARCLSVCPTGAITSAGDTVVIDTDVCAGCGECAAVCPSGAASYDDPPVSVLFARLRTLASEFRRAGGQAPRALFHEADWGGEMIRLSARFGRGLPPDVIPVEVSSIEGVGHAETLAALGVGFASVAVMPGPRSDTGVILRELALAEAIAGQGRLSVLDVSDPDAMEAALWDAEIAQPVADPILPLGGRREVTRLAGTALNVPDAVLELPEGAPYGAVVIDTEACTLCLACVSLCPVAALGDNPDKPQVTFREAACLQCGICASTCPEDAITLAPRLDLSKEALAPRVLNEEEPFDCINCGKPFGVRSTIEKIVEKLEDKHWMFKGSDNVKLIQMCDDCRISAQYHQEGSPFRMGDRPKPRTTDDYLKERKPH